MTDYKLNRRAKRKGITPESLLSQEIYEKEMLDKGYKFCISCNDWKIFGKSAAYCKGCCSNKTKGRYNKERQQAYLLKKKYGITVEQYNLMRNNQNYKCYICNIDEDKLDRALAVDHCHHTGKVRGLLCGNCNRFLGQINDNVETAERMVQYLKMAKNK
jgi:hypothetical protein